MEYKLITTDIKLSENATAVEKIFANRGFTPEEMRHYLNTTDADLVPPEKMTNMREGAEMLIRHIGANDLIDIIVD